ncbi:MAG: flagellar protein FliS [Thermomicrobiales bacterium]|jgi:flagellar protein FliS|nr:flagellar protein FliS [Thermomicrobiales bacterium]
MSHTGHDAYLEGRILSADPLELVRLLYQGCSDAVREARRRLADGDIAGRSRAITRAYEILAELIYSLDRERGGEIGERLALLYDYMQRRLIEANCRQEDAPLAEVVSLLATLGEAWESVQQQTRPAAETANPWGQTPAAEPEVVGSHAWSL